MVPAQYFKKKRGIANGLVYAGGGIGGAVMSLTIDSLLRTLGPPWTFRIVGFITFAVTMPAAWLIKDRIRLQQMMMVEWFALFARPPCVLSDYDGHANPVGFLFSSGNCSKTLDSSSCSLVASLALSHSSYPPSSCPSMALRSDYPQAPRPG